MPASQHSPTAGNGASGVSTTGGSTMQSSASANSPSQQRTTKHQDSPQHQQQPQANGHPQNGLISHTISPNHATVLAAQNAAAVAALQQQQQQQQQQLQQQQLQQQQQNGQQLSAYNMNMTPEMQHQLQQQIFQQQLLAAQHPTNAQGAPQSLSPANATALYHQAYLQQQHQQYQQQLQMQQFQYQQYLQQMNAAYQHQQQQQLPQQQGFTPPPTQQQPLAPAIQQQPAANQLYQQQIALASNVNHAMNNVAAQQQPLPTTSQTSPNATRAQSVYPAATAGSLVNRAQPRPATVSPVHTNTVMNGTEPTAATQPQQISLAAIQPHQTHTQTNHSTVNAMPAAAPSLAHVPQIPQQSLHTNAITAPGLPPAAQFTAEFREQLKRLEMRAQNAKQRHKYLEAINLYDQILWVDQTLTTALVNKGICHKCCKDNASAVQCFLRVLSMSPNDWQSHNQLGLIYKESDLFEKAIEHYKLAIQYGPTATTNSAYENMAIVLTDLGTRLKLNGNTDHAIESYNEALTYDSRYCPAYFNLGVVYSERGSLDKALKQYQLAIDYNPNYVEALCNIGVIYKNAQQLSIAIEFYERALKSNPNFMIASNNLAIALTDMGTAVKHSGKLEDGITYYKRALAQNSKYPAAWYNLGVAYAEKARHEDAKICYEMALLFDPKCAEAFNNLGVIYKDRGNLDQAIYYYLEALKANSKFSQTLNNLGVIYTMLGKLDEAYSYCQSAIRANSSYAEAHNNLGVLFRDEGRIDEAIASYEQCLKIDPASRNAGQNRLLAMNSLCKPNMTDAELCSYVYEAHSQWGQQFRKLYADKCYKHWANDTTLPLTRPLRIGYISADFFTHSVSYFIEAPLQYANRSHTHVFCYSNVARKDKKTQHLQTLAHEWRTIHDLTTADVAKLVRADEIDILIELTGHTAGNRLDVMAMKPAPIQCTWIGYPNTTGLSTIDYRFTDRIVDTPTTQQQYTEQLVYLEDGPFLCYTPPADAPAVSQTPAIARGYVTFGSFNNLAKVNDSVIDCWCRCLDGVPNSRMLIKCKPFASATVCNKMLARFAERGISPDRVDLISLLPTTSEHLDTYSQIDISLDTFPYAGTTTTCEALYMGVPVVSYKQPFSIHAHNVGATLLSRIADMNQLIGNSEDEYVHIACKLASDVERLQSLRQSLRPKMIQSDLCDGKKFGKILESTYKKLWQEYCQRAGNTPSPSSATTNGHTPSQPQVQQIQSAAQSTATSPSMRSSNNQ